ncbi:MAG: hypothetical protein FJZ63_02080 [Chlamydiae bacterium]|nr:hypothetical protein [Chlamydiota bacterium]
MSSFLPTIILRHRKENLKKCSLKGLESAPDMVFYTYPSLLPNSLEGYLMLYLADPPAPPLSPCDARYGLFFLDSTWNYERAMHSKIKENHTLIYRSLPSTFMTAYPRKQTACIAPDQGLATVEALYIAYKILGRDASHILQHYYWKEDFLKKNVKTFALLEKSLQTVQQQ